MKPEQQRIAIAKACGWTAEQDSNGYWRAAKQKDAAVELWLSERTVWSVGIPDYCNDLNAMHEAEKVKEMAFNSDYAYWLAHIAVRDRGLEEDKLNVGDGFEIALTATAAQRAEAFSRTINQWEVEE